MVADQLSLNFLTNHIDKISFDRIKDCYDQLLLDGQFTKKYNDKELGVQLFLNSISNDFFYTRHQLHNFIESVPQITQDRILADLRLSSIKKINWNQKTSDYFVNELGLPEKFAIEILNDNEDSINGFVEYSKPLIRFKNLKEYQSKVFFKAYDYLSSVPFARCIIQMPTGSGKTRTAMEIVCETINDTSGDVLWLANTQELCDQAFDSFTEVWQFIGKKACCALNHLRFKNPLPLNSQSFNVATIQSFRDGNIAEKIRNLGISELALVVIDEAHIATAPTYRNSLLQLVSNGSKLLGLTATPGRQLANNISGNDENKELSDFFFNTKFELETNKDNPIEFLRSKGVLANAVFTSIEGAIVEEVLTENEIKECKRKKTIPQKVISLLTDDNSRNTRILDQLISLLKDGKKVIFFATSLDHSKMISTLINMKGYKSAHVDGSTGSFRKKAISKFKNGEIQLLCNYSVLSTGFDDPLIDVVFMARPTNSIVLYSQIIGRGLRGPLIGGTDFCEVITVLDNISDLPENNEIYSYFDEYFLS